MSAHSIFSQKPDDNDRPWVLAIDLGTTSTMAVIADASGTEVLEIDGSRSIPSGVLLGDDGELIAGPAATQQASSRPDRFERTPKSYIGTEYLVLGGQAVRVVDAIAGVLSLVLAEASRRHNGRAPTRVGLTHPSSWEEGRKNALLEAARVAGLPTPALMAEPVAAAVHLAGDRLAPGATVAVYDLGGGTFDAAVLRLGDDGFELAGPPGGIDQLGGEDFDRAVYAHFGAVLAAESPEAWESLQSSDERAWRRASADLLGECRRAKEALSRQGSYTAYVPAPVDRDVRITRLELEELIREQIAATVAEMKASLVRAKTPARKLAGVYLVGGSSRVPLVSTLVAESLGKVPETRDDPKAVVALGAAEALMGRLAATPAASGQASVVVATAAAGFGADPNGRPVQSQKKGRRSRRIGKRVLTAVTILAMLRATMAVSQLVGATPGRPVNVQQAAAAKLAGTTTTTSSTATAAASAPVGEQASAEPATREQPASSPPPATASVRSVRFAPGGQGAGPAAATQGTATAAQPPSSPPGATGSSAPTGPATPTDPAAPPPASAGPPSQATPPPATAQAPTGPAVNSVVQISEQSAGFSWFGPVAYRYYASSGNGGHNYYTGAVPYWGTDCGGGTVNNSARWSASLPGAGKYRLDVFIPHEGSTTTNAQYNVFAADGEHTVGVNQKVVDSQWVTLGTWTMSVGRLELIDVTGDACKQTQIAYDDVRWVYLGT